MYCHHILSKTTTGYTQSKIRVAHISTRTDTARVFTRGVWRCTWTMYTFHADTYIIFFHVTNTRMISQGERKLDRLRRESKGATNEAPTCAVPMHVQPLDVQSLSDTSSLWQWVGEVTSDSEVTVEGRYRVQPRLLSEKGKKILSFVKCQGCGSNSEELIRPKCFCPTLRYKELVEEESCEKNIVEPCRPSLDVYVHTHAHADVPAYKFTPTPTRMQTGTYE